MKTIFLSLTIIAALATLIATCFGQDPDEVYVESADNLKDSEEDIAEANMDIQKAQAIFNLDYQKFKKDFQEKYKNKELRVSDLKAEVLKMNVKDKSAEYQKMVSDLAQKNYNLKKKLSDYTNEGSDDWTSFKNKFNLDMDELGKALKNFTIMNNGKSN
jgi:hypothetical protein